MIIDFDGSSLNVWEPETTYYGIRNFNGDVTLFGDGEESRLERDAVYERFYSKADAGDESGVKVTVRVVVELDPKPEPVVSVPAATVTETEIETETLSTVGADGIDVWTGLPASTEKTEAAAEDA